MTNLELRCLASANLRASSTSRRIEGYAAVFDQLSDNLGGFREKIRQGTFSRAIREGQDVRALVDHDASKLLGRTTAGTLRLNEDSHGLEFSVSVPNTTVGNDALVSVARGDMNQASFGFRVKQDTWSNNHSVRELLDVDLFDVSVVTYPAYPQTSVSVRTASGDKIEVRWYRGEADEPAIVPPDEEQLEKLKLRLRLSQLIK